MKFILDVLYIGIQDLKSVFRPLLIYFITACPYSQVVYEKTFAEKFGNNHGSAKSTIESAFVHAQTYYCHASLGTKLKIDRLGDIGFYNQKFGADDLYSRQVLAVTKQNIGTADIMVYLTGSTSTDDGILLGIAGCLGCVCDTEIGDSTSRISGWQVYKTKYWGRHSAIFYSGNLLQFSYVSTQVELRMVYFPTLK